MPLFDRYLFADYSGGAENHHAQGNIRLYRCTGSSDPERLMHSVKARQTDQPQNFSRDALFLRVRRELAEATDAGERVLFGFDHQYAWPPHLRRLAGIAECSWRTALLRLDTGDANSGLPPLDIPCRYCAAFNRFCGQDVFWTPLLGIAAKYEIPRKPLHLPAAERFRLTELVPPVQGSSRPKAADAVGGQGAGLVGGQTICGLHQIARMLDDPFSAWWPFDGFDIRDQAYLGKHVGIEIYPSAFRPAHVARDDDADAYHSCLYLRDADRADELSSLAVIAPPVDLRERIRKEGWIVGMDPRGLVD